MGLRFGAALRRNSTTNHNIAFLALARPWSARRTARRTVYARGLVRLSRLTEKMGNSFWTYRALGPERAGFGDLGTDGEVALLA